MSFMLTAPQMRARTKTVTRRLGWLFLEVGETVLAVERCQGIKTGQTVEVFGPIQVIAVSREPLDRIDQADVDAEGFPDRTPAQFVLLFCEAFGCRPDTVVTRIAFDHLGVR